MFSFGFVTHEGPSRDEMDNVEFTFTMHGNGWSEKLAEPTDQHAEPPNKTKVVKVKELSEYVTIFYFCISEGPWES